MTTWQEALQNASKTKTWRVGYCDNFVANMWGFSSSGYNDAVSNWDASPVKNPGSTLAPAGTLVYWGGGYGHVALSAGDGTVFSTDIGGPGTVTRVPISEITNKWNKPYLGWAAPYFQGQTPNSFGPIASDPAGKTEIDKIIGDIGSIITNPLGTVEQAASSVFSIPSDIVKFFGDATNGLTDVMSVFKAFFQPATYIRIGAGAFGFIFLIAAALFMIREGQKNG